MIKLKTLLFEKGYGVDKIAPRWMNKSEEIIFNIPSNKQLVKSYRNTNKRDSFTADYFPLTKKQYSNFGKSRNLTVYHTTSPKMLKNLIQNQNDSHRQISCRSKYGDFQGVWGSGIIAQLNAFLIFHQNYDIDSIPDETGRRWIHIYFVFEKSKFSNDANKLAKTAQYEWREKRNKFYMKYYDDFFKQYNDQKPLHDFVKKFFQQVYYPFVNKYKKILFDQINPENDQDEIVVTKYKINKVYLSQKLLKKKHIKDCIQLLQKFNIKYQIIQ